METTKSNNLSGMKIRKDDFVAGTQEIINFLQALFHYVEARWTDQLEELPWTDQLDGPLLFI